MVLDHKSLKRGDAEGVTDHGGQRQSRLHDHPNEGRKVSIYNNQKKYYENGTFGSDWEGLGHDFINNKLKPQYQEGYFNVVIGRSSIYFYNNDAKFKISNYK